MYIEQDHAVILATAGSRTSTAQSLYSQAHHINHLQAEPD